MISRGSGNVRVTSSCPNKSTDSHWIFFKKFQTLQFSRLPQSTGQGMAGGCHGNGCGTFSFSSELRAVWVSSDDTPTPWLLLKDERGLRWACEWTAVQGCYYSAIYVGRDNLSMAFQFVVLSGPLVTFRHKVTNLRNVLKVKFHLKRWSRCGVEIFK